MIHPPIVHGNDEVPILELVPPPELHLLTGPMNTLFKELKALYLDEANKWLSLCQGQRDLLHGDSFKGSTVTQNSD